MTGTIKRTKQEFWFQLPCPIGHLRRDIIDHLREWIHTGHRETSHSSGDTRSNKTLSLFFPFEVRPSLCLLLESLPLTLSLRDQYFHTVLYSDQSALDSLVFPTPIRSLPTPLNTDLPGSFWWENLSVRSWVIWKIQFIGGRDITKQIGHSLLCQLDWVPAPLSHIFWAPVQMPTSLPMPTFLNKVLSSSTHGKDGLATSRTSKESWQCAGKRNCDDK